MWGIGLACDGCPTLLGDLFAVRHRGIAPGAGRGELRHAGWALKVDAERQGWEKVDAPDGEEWFCPTCRRARDGKLLTNITEAHQCKRP